MGMLVILDIYAYFGYPWISMDFHRLPWIATDIHLFPHESKIFLDIHGSRKSANPWEIQNILGIHGKSKLSLSFHT